MAQYTQLPVTDPDDLGFASSVDVAFGSATDEVVIDTTNRIIALKVTGNLTKDGVTIKAFYSKLKDAWQSDTGGPGSSNRLVKFPFPMNPITDEQFEMVDGWTLDKTNTSGAATQKTEELLRTGGWQVIREDNVEVEKWISVISLGTLGATDQVYYQQADSKDPIDIVLTDVVNQGVQVYAATGSVTDVGFDAGNGTGTGNIIYSTGDTDLNVFQSGDQIVVDSSINDGTYTVNSVIDANTIDVTELVIDENPGNATTITVDYRKYFKIFVREWQKTYAASTFEDIGVDTSTTGPGAVFQAYRFPLTNATDPDVPVTLNETDISTGGTGLPDQDPYQNVTLTFLRDANGNLFNIIGDVAGTTAYEIGDVVYYPTDDNWYNVVGNFTSVASPDPSADGANFTLYTGQRLVGSANYAFNKIIDGDTNVGATVSGENRLSTIYHSVQYQLRQTDDIDLSSGVSAGKTTDALLNFVGPTLVTTEGVYIDSFNSADNNDITLTTIANGTGLASTVSFPFKAQITINFGQNLQDDGNAKYYLFFANAGGNLFGTSNAIIVQDAEDPVANIAGDVSGSGSVSRSFDYTNNTQGNRTGGTDANVVGVAIGLVNSQYVKAEGVIQESVTNSLSLSSALERNYTI